MFWVYGLKSQAGERIYIGQTNDLEKRIKYHNEGKVISTKVDRPWTLFACEKFDTGNGSRWRERQLKKSRGTRMKWPERHSTGLGPGGVEKKIRIPFYPETDELRRGKQRDEHMA